MAKYTCVTFCASLFAVISLTACAGSRPMDGDGGGGSGGQAPTVDAGVDVTTDDARTGCGSHEKVCGDQCVSVYDSAHGCSLVTCDPCRFFHAYAGCGADGACEPSACESGWSDCDGKPGNGCEVNTGGDFLNCGACGHACEIPGSACIHGQCVP